MNWKRLSKAILFPNIAIMIILAPLSLVLLVGSMVFIGVDSPVSYISYVLSAYTLTVWCFKIPDTVRFLKKFRDENRYAKIWRENARLRVNVSLYSSLVWNALYGLFQLWLGFYHRTFWFSSLGAYYVLLGVMRFFLVRHTTSFALRENIRDELRKYRACGVILLFMNLAISIIVFFMVYFGRTFQHHMITAIAMALYTFTALALAIVNLLKYRKYKSPVYSAAKITSLAAALISLLTLESTMLTTFGEETMTVRGQQWMLGLTGALIAALVVSAAIYMIVTGTKGLKKIKTEDENGKGQSEI